jgi:hypothetical protein
MQTKFPLLLLHLLVLIGAMAAVWWFVFPDSPAEAIADTINAAAVAGYAEVKIGRWWS